MTQGDGVRFHTPFRLLHRSRRGVGSFLWPIKVSVCDGACSLSDHVDYDVRESDRNGVRRIELSHMRVGTLGFELELFHGNDRIEQRSDLPARLARPCSRCQFLVQGCQVDGALGSNHQGEQALRHVVGEKVAILVGLDENIRAAASVGQGIRDQVTDAAKSPPAKRTRQSFADSPTPGIGEPA
jgi:hypothetical protein